MSTSIRCTKMNLRKLHDISSFPCKSGTENTCHCPSNTGTFPATELALFETVCAGSALAVFIRPSRELCPRKRLGTPPCRAYACPPQINEYLPRQKPIFFKFRAIVAPRRFLHPTHASMYLHPNKSDILDSVHASPESEPSSSVARTTNPVISEQIMSMVRHDQEVLITPSRGSDRCPGCTSTPQG